MAPKHPDAKSIFFDAIEKLSPDEWPAHLDRVCSDDAELRRRVRELLDAHGSMQSPPSRVPGATAPTLDIGGIAEQPGAQIGRYKLVHEIGHGGMGVVYMAVQKEPVKRKVALKIIKPGMDTREVVTRFEAERQALALMDHQSIATVLDGGSTESGRPYFVMELVDGTPITEYCDACRYTTRQRLELFMQVCQAVQHAHQKGVIHRDIKPSNILVTHYDDKAVPKVIDFGIAKATGHQLTDQSLYTHVSQIVGTPLYMSPEQAQHSGQDVDTRTDVYSLGVLLYELLTGTTPFDKERLKSSALDEVKRIIREEEPPKPSTRLSTVNVALETVAEKHHTDLRTLTKELRGELDWIVMKALEKDRSRRYETASAFARDVQRYLNDETVEACPPSRTYQLSKFARRHSVGLAAATLVSLSLVTGAGVATWQAVRASAAAASEERAREFAQEKQAEAERQQTLAEERQTEAEQQREIARRNMQRAQEAVDAFLTQVSEEELLNAQSLQPLRKDLLELALAYYRQFAEENAEDPDIQEGLAEAYRRVGDIQSTLGANREAEAAHRESLALYNRLVTGRLEDSKYLKSLGVGYVQLATPLWSLGRSDDVVESLEKAREISATAGKDHPDYLAIRNVLGFANIQLAHMEFLGPKGEPYVLEAKAIYEELVAADPTERKYRANFANALETLGEIARRSTVRPEEAIDYFTEAMTIRRQLAEEEPDSLGGQKTLAEAYVKLGYAHHSAQQNGLAENNIREGVAIHEQLVRENPLVHDYSEKLLVGYSYLGTVLEHKDLSQALEIREKAYRLAQQQLSQYPDDLNAKQCVSIALMDLGGTKMNNGDYSDALIYFHQAMALNRGIADEYPTVPRTQTISKLHNCIAVAELKMGRPEDAIESYETAVELAQEWFPKRNPHRRADVATRLVGYYSNLVKAHLATGNYDAALSWSDKAIELLEDLVERISEPTSFREKLAEAYGSRVNLLMASRRLEEAISACNAAIENDPENQIYWLSRARVYTSQRNFDEAVSDYTHVLEVQPDSVKALVERGQCYAEMSKYQQALADLSQAVEVEPSYVLGQAHLAWLLATCPDASLRKPLEALSAAEAAIESRANDGSYWKLLGVAQYRNDQFEQAIESLEKAVSLSPNLYDCATDFFLAMAYWRLDRRPEARRSFDQAQAWMEEHSPDDEELQRFRAEAAELLGIDDKPNEEEPLDKRKELEEPSNDEEKPSDEVK